MIRLSTHLCCCSPLPFVWPSCKLSAHTAELGHLTVRYVVCLSVCLRRVACQSYGGRGRRWLDSAAHKQTGGCLQLVTDAGVHGGYRVVDFVPMKDAAADTTTPRL